MQIYNQFNLINVHLRNWNRAGGARMLGNGITARQLEYIAHTCKHAHTEAVFLFESFRQA